MEQTAKKNETSGRLVRLDAIEQHWDEIDALLRGLPSSEYVASLLRELGSPATPAEIGVDKAMLRNTFLYCKEVRARYTILQLLWDLAVLEPVSQQVIDAL